MLRAQALFGPDHSALQAEGACALGRNLLRMVPDDIVDRQPLAFAGGRYRLVADVRLDNRDELLSQLDVSAARARMLADSALLALAFERWGIDDTLPKLVGVFAIVVWDRQEECLILARDPMGLRPLFYSRQDGFIAVSSMPKGLFALADVPRDLNEPRVATYVSLLPADGAETLYKHLRRVEPGHRVRLSQQGEDDLHWCDFSTIEEQPFASFDEALEALDEVMDRAVRAQLRSIGGVGCHLSGGLDSGVVAAMAAKVLAERGQSLHAYTAAPRTPQDLPPSLRHLGDESGQAARVAAHFPNVSHHIVFNDCRSMSETNARYVAVMDETPLNPTNMVWIDGIHRMAREQGVRTVLSGQMGNLTFSAGHELVGPEFENRYSTAALLMRVLALARVGDIRFRPAVSAILRGLIPRPAFLALRRLLSRAAPIKTGAVFLNDHILDEHDLVARVEQRFQTPGFAGGLGRNFRAFLMHQVDMGSIHKAYMGLDGIDMRDPTGDLRVIKLCLSLPVEMFSRGRDRAFGRGLYQRHISSAALAQFMKGRQAADSAGLFLSEQETFSATVTRATTRSALFKDTDVTAFLEYLRQRPNQDLTIRQANVQQLELCVYSRLLGISQLLNHLDDGNG
jgi:asparagine synthase (glutamine-hydrolysing)